MASKKEQLKPISPKPLPNKTITNNDTNLVSSFIDTNVTKVITKDVINKDTKHVLITKNLIIGKKKITANFSSTKTVRPNYNLSEETVEKIEKISDLLGYKKAEFLDIYLNGTLEKVLKNLEKNK